MQLRPQTGDWVIFHYAVKLKDGTIHETSRGKEPSRRLLGDDDLHPKILAAFLSMRKSEVKQVPIPCAEGYGQPLKQLIFTCPRSDFPEELKFEVGQSHDVTDPKGETRPVKVIAMDETSVTFDANHVLAGKDLIYELELLEFRKE